MGKWAAAIAAALALAAVYGMATFDAVSGTGMPLYSSQRYDPFGASALRELLAARGRTASVLRQAVPPDGPPATLVTLVPLSRNVNLDARRVQRLRDWVRAGNRWLVLSRYAPPELAAEYQALDWRSGDIHLARLEEGARYRDALAFHNDPFLRHAWTEGDAQLVIALAEAGGFGPERDASATVLAAADGEALALSVPLGDGELALVASPSPALNAGIDRENNAQWLLSLVGTDQIWFDEYALGLGADPSFMDWFRAAGLMPFLAQAALALFLLARSGDSDLSVPDVQDGDPAAEGQIRLLAELYNRTLTDDELYRELENENGHERIRRHTK